MWDIILEDDSSLSCWHQEQMYKLVKDEMNLMYISHPCFWLHGWVDLLFVVVHDPTSVQRKIQKEETNQSSGSFISNSNKLLVVSLSSVSSKLYSCHIISPSERLSDWVKSTTSFPRFCPKIGKKVVKHVDPLMEWFFSFLDIMMEQCVGCG